MTSRAIARLFLAVAFVAAGAMHLLVPALVVGIMPSVVPMKPAVVFVTGIAEILGAVGLMVPGLRRAAGIGLALYAVCVFPANIQHAVNDLSLADPLLGWPYHGPRLLFQPVIVWWALWVGEVINWPFRRRQAA